MSPPAVLSTDPNYTDLPVGEILRRARLQKKMTIEDAELYLHIRASHLEALERSDFDALPGSTYVVGFIRTYAEFLGLDGGRVITLLKKQTSELGIVARAAQGTTIPTDNRLPNVPVMAASLAGFLLIMVLWVGYQGMRLYPATALSDIGATPLSVDAMRQLSGMVPTVQPEHNKVEVTRVLNPAPVVPAVPQPPLKITARADAWLEVKYPDGRIWQAREFKKGESLSITEPVDEFGNAYVLTTDDAAAIEVQIDGKSLLPLGKAGEVLRNVSLRPETLRAVTATP